MQKNNLWANLLIFSYFSCITDTQRHGFKRCSATLCGKGGRITVVTCPSGCLLQKEVSLASDMKSMHYFAHQCSSIKPESLQKQGWWDRPTSSRFGGWTGQRPQQVLVSHSIRWGIPQTDLQPPCRGNHHKHPLGEKALHGRDNARKVAHSLVLSSEKGRLFFTQLEDSE